MVALADRVRLPDLSTRVVFEFQVLRFAHYMFLTFRYLLAKIVKLNLIEISVISQTFMVLVVSLQTSLIREFSVITVSS